jgi:hypothetical protein
LTVTSLPTLHLPDEPTARAEAWLAALLGGQELTVVLRAEDGFIPWLWSRWSSLDRAGVTPEEFAQIVLAYRREIWLWLAGERVWTQCCSGLVGRIGRRMGQVDTPSV